MGGSGGVSAGRTGTWAPVESVTDWAVVLLVRLESVAEGADSRSLAANISCTAVSRIVLWALETSIRTPHFFASNSSCDDQCMVYMRMAASGRTREISRAGAKSVHHWHCKIKNNHVGMKLNCANERGLTIFRIGDFVGAALFQQMP